MEGFEQGEGGGVGGGSDVSKFSVGMLPGQRETGLELTQNGSRKLEQWTLGSLG